MKSLKYISLFCLFTIAQLGCIGTSTTEQTLHAEPATDVAESDENAAEFIIDVRSKEEWDAGHLEQAVWIPHEEIKEKIAGVTEDKSAAVILYCKSGGRAGRAKEALESMGYTNVENAGGLEDIKKRYEEK